MAAAVVALALAGNDEVVLEQVCLAGKADFLVQVGADAAASLRVEQGEVANDEAVAAGTGLGDRDAHANKLCGAGGWAC